MLFCLSLDPYVDIALDTLAVIGPVFFALSPQSRTVRSMGLHKYADRIPFIGPLAIQQRRGSMEVLGARAH